MNPPASCEPSKTLDPHTHPEIVAARRIQIRGPFIYRQRDSYLDISSS